MADEPQSTANWGIHFGGKQPSLEVYAQLRQRHPLVDMFDEFLLGDVDFRQQFPPVYDQEPFNACTGNAMAAIIQYHRARQGLPELMPSRLFIYWFGRVVDHTQGSDAGTSISSVIAGLDAHGYCNETTWPYIGQDLMDDPSDEATAEGSHHRVGPIQQVNGVQAIRGALARGWPVAFQMRIWNSFYQGNYNSGLVPMPTDSANPFDLHAAVFVGYNDQRQVFVMRSSWGLQVPNANPPTPWGDQGHFYIPYAYAGNPVMVFDTYAIQAVSDA